MTSPSILDLQIEHLDTNEYIPMEYSNIFLSLSDFLNLNQKLANKNSNAEKDQKKKKYNINQNCFYFEDYIETNKKIKNLKTILFFKIDLFTFFFIHLINTNF